MGKNEWQYVRQSPPTHSPTSVNSRSTTVGCATYAVGPVGLSMGTATPNLSLAGVSRHSDRRQGRAETDETGVLWKAETAKTRTKCRRCSAINSVPKFPACTPAERCFVWISRNPGLAGRGCGLKWALAPERLRHVMIRTGTGDSWAPVLHPDWAP